MKYPIFCITKRRFAWVLVELSEGFVRAESFVGPFLVTRLNPWPSNSRPELPHSWNQPDILIQPTYLTPDPYWPNHKINPTYWANPTSSEIFGPDLTHRLNKADDPTNRHKCLPVRSAILNAKILAIRIRFCLHNNNIISTHTLT